MKLVFGLTGLLSICVGIILGINYFKLHIKVYEYRPEISPQAGAELKILNWNLGYAGLGKDSDFVMDGGEMLRPPSKDHVAKNLEGIREILKRNKADIHIFQEISEPDMLTHGIHVLAGVSEEFSGYNEFFSSDFRTRYIPTRWALRHGLATFTKVKSEPVSLIRLPLEPTKLGGIIQRMYHIQETELSTSDGADWVILNIHLSAFDEGGDVRLKQMDRLIEVANEYYQDGKHVIVGGDWNIQLADTEFPNTTKEEFLFWRTKLPREKILPGWQIIVDEQTPTMRSNERPFVKGENFTSIIDGFMVSPNVDALSVKTIDTNFEFTDHQPVFAKFRARK